MTSTYDISKVRGCDIKSVYDNNNNENKNKNLAILKDHNIVFNTCSTAGSTYRILKYDKKFLTPSTICDMGLFRSIVLRDEKIMCFSPPKSVSEAEFMKKNQKPNKKNIVAEEFVEGTMINVFFDKTVGDEGDWEVCTRSNIGARMAFFRNGEVNYENTFRYMFLEAANNANLDFDHLRKEYCYSFVLQHPKNRIVLPIKEPLIYLVGCYKIDNDNKIVSEIDREDQILIMEKTMVCFAGRFSFDSYDELRSKWASDNTDYKTMGIVIKNIETGERTKMRNPNYECIRKLRGNQPKLQYQYLILRKEGNVSKYLSYFDEARESFSEFRKQVHNFTSKLHTNYIMCYVKKEKPLIQYSSQYRTHMFNLHKIYMERLRDNSEKVTKKVVIDYINELHPSKLMFSLNYHMRQSQIDNNTTE
jgi:hypothetical protein